MMKRTLEQSEETIEEMLKRHEKEKLYWYQENQDLKQRCDDLEKALNKASATPGTLLEAINNGLLTGKGPEEIYIHVKDFLSQHFTSAMLYDSDEEKAKKLKALFQRITSHKAE